MKTFFLVLSVILVPAAMFAQNQPPALFYSDLTSGPVSGGQNNAGAFVTLHGKGFGSSRGSSTVTVGGGLASSYPVWTDSTITLQLGALAKSGNIVVKVGGVTSNSVPFAVRAGGIYFVSRGGSNSNAGSYSAPWHTVVYAASKMQAGDIVYLEYSVVPNAADTGSSALVLSAGGTAAAPMALVAYPNSTITIGSSTGPAVGINIAAGNWVLSGLTLRGALTAVSIAGVSGVRLVNSDVSCPNGFGVASCIASSGGSSFAFLGNKIHDNGSPTDSDLESYEAMYLLGSSEVEIGWNTIANTHGCNAIGVHSDTGLQFTFSVHDNYISNTRCGAISLGTVDPSQGAVKVYNNVIVNSGTGPVPGGTPEGYGYSAIVIGGASSSPAEVFNNTIYNSGAMGGSNAGAVRAFGALQLNNNIFDLLSGEQYVSLDTNLSWITGSHNLFFGAGNPLGIFANSVAGNPMFVSLANGNFHLQAGSAAIDTGATLPLSTDYDGVLRPQGAAYDIGAFEFPAPSAGGTLSVAPTSIGFSSTTVGQTATTTATLSNSSNASVTISQVNSNNAAFQTSGISFPLTLSAGQSATLTVTFAPAVAGAASGTIAIASSAVNSPTTIATTGTGLAAAPSVSLSPTALTFASQVITTTSAAQTITLTNRGTAPLTLSSIKVSGDFSQTNTCGTSLPVSSSCSISVVFTPTAAGTRPGALSFTDNAAASPQQVSLSGTATTAPSSTLLAGATSLSFGSIATGANHSQNLVITNTGTASATISQISTGSSVFSVSCTTLPATIATGSSLTLAVKFAPSATGPYTGTLTVQSNASNPTLSVGLSGTGTAPLHNVSLSWTETSTPVSGYNVYRSSVSGATYLKINSSLVASQSYIDASVTGGQTYYYVVTAVNASGIESGYSPQMSAVVPSS